MPTNPSIPNSWSWGLCHIWEYFHTWFNTNKPNLQSSSWCQALEQLLQRILLTQTKLSVLQFLWRCRHNRHRIINIKITKPGATASSPGSILYVERGPRDEATQGSRCSPIESEDISICCGFSLVGKSLHNHGVQGKEKLYSIKERQFHNQVHHTFDPPPPKATRTHSYYAFIKLLSLQ